MGTRTKDQTKRLQLVAGFVPPPVKDFIKETAKNDGRTESQVVRRLLEQSPEVKAELRRVKKTQAA